MRPKKIKVNSGLFFLTALVIAAFLLPVRGTAGEFLSPLGGRTHLTSTFGEIRGDHLHNGIDFSVSHQRGRKARAVASGRVVEVFFDPDRYGKSVIVEHPSGYRSWYSHLDALAPRLRRAFNRRLRPNLHLYPENTLKVSRGEPVGLVGNTGEGPIHLHLILQNPAGKFVNPLGHFSPPLDYDPEPVIQKISLIPLDGNSWVQGEGGEFTVSPDREKPVDLRGRLAVAARVSNDHQKSANTGVPFRTDLLLNGETVATKIFDSLDGRELNAAPAQVFLLNRSNIAPTQYTLFFTNHGSDGELFFEEPGESGQLTLRSVTKRGRVTRETVDYRVVSKRAKSERAPDAHSRGQISFGNSRQVAVNTLATSGENKYPPGLVSEQSETAEAELAVEKINKRVKFTIEAGGAWRGWPEVLIKGGKFERRFTPDRVAPGKFIGWWTPSDEREGWHKVVLRKHSGEGGKVIEKKRVYLQFLFPGQNGAVSSPDGIFTLFSDGSAPGGSHLVNFKRRADLSVGEVGFEPVSPVYRLTPFYVQSAEEMYLNAFIPGNVRRPRQVGLYNWNPVAKKWEVLSYESPTGGAIELEREAKVLNFPTVALFRDSRVPEIVGVEFSSATNRIILRLSHTPSGYNPGDVAVYFRGEKLYSYLEDEPPQLTVPADQIEKSGGIRLQVRIKDRAGNQNSGSYRISIP